jgi:hypothetical protein
LIQIHNTECRRYNIAYICLPPNSTDKLQPLDVGIFGPVKSSWRAVLAEYKTQNPLQVGVPKTVFPSLLKKTLDRANPGQHMAAAFRKCGLYPVDPSKAMERIPSRDMDAPETIRELLNSTLGEKLDQLRGTGRKEKAKGRGQKIKVAPGKSYSAPVLDSESEEEDEDEEGLDEVEVDSEDEDEVETLLREMDDDERKGKGKGKAPTRRPTLPLQVSDSDSDMDDELPDLDNEPVDPAAGGSWRSRPANFPVGSFVVAVYDKAWYVAQVEGEEPEEETEGFTLLKYMERKGVNQFVWGKVSDRLKTLHTDILLKVEPPIPVSSRLWGLPKDVVKEVEKLFRVLWSIIFHKPKYILQGLIFY